MLKGIAFHDTNLARIFQLTITNAKFFQKNIPACRKLMGEPENFGRIITSNNKKILYGSVRKDVPEWLLTEPAVPGCGVAAEHVEIYFALYPIYATPVAKLLNHIGVAFFELFGVCECAEP